MGLADLFGFARGLQVLFPKTGSLAFRRDTFILLGVPITFTFSPEVVSLPESTMPLESESDLTRRPFPGRHA